MFLKSVNNRLRSGTGKNGRLEHVIETRETSCCRSLRSLHFIWFLTTWITVKKIQVFVQISMLGRVKNRHYSSCFIKNNFISCASRKL